MSVFAFFVFLVLLEIFSFALFKDFLSPACLVCESFLLAFFCACYSSHAEGWNFELHVATETIIFVGIFSFIIGSFFSKTFKCKKCIINKTDISFIEPRKRSMHVLLLLQIAILMVYVFFFIHSVRSIEASSLSEILRYQRFYSSYGEGLELPIPSIVSHMTKITRANAYISLYILTHNIAVKGVTKSKSPKGMLVQLLIVFLYLPYSILQSARFELFVVLVMALIIWYTYLRMYSAIMGSQRRSTSKAIRIIIGVALVAAGLFSILGTLVGRSGSASIFVEAADYFGRTMQALDLFVINGIHNKGMINNESFYNIVKLMKQLHLVDGEQPKFFLGFTSLSGYSLGNTYTALRRFYADFDIWGVIIFSYFEGLLFSLMYRKSRKPQAANIDFRFLCYSSIVYCCFLFCYEEFFWATVLSLNYALIFIIMYFVKLYAMGEINLWH